MPGTVSLSVYDLNDNVSSMNSVMKRVGTGVYHCGVVVYGEEWSFGLGGGVYSCRPQGNTSHKFKQSIDMGSTSLSAREVAQVLGDLKDLWVAEEYRLLQHNCCDFSNEFCKRLGVGVVPGWVKSAAGLAAHLDDTLHARHLAAVVDKGKVSRGVTEEDAYKLGDLTRGAASSVASATNTLLKRGEISRGERGNPGYVVGDLTRGVASSVRSAGSTVLVEGKRAREATESDRYKFGDVTRGVVSLLAKR